MSEPSFDPIPDLADAVQGWRAFDVVVNDPEPVLWSVARWENYWPPCQPAVSQCNQCGDEGPKMSCTCGLHAANSLPHLRSMEYHRFDTVRRPGSVRVVAVVALWGPDLIVGSLGWRARYGYPRLLLVPYAGWQSARALAYAYRIPFRIVDTLNI